ncbi:hypothetical protein CUMW_224740, partial [Citrus unshiu]
MIQAVLSDAEEKQLTDEAVKMWLDELQDLAYDAEDILDEFGTQALESKLMAKNQDSTGQVLSFIPASLNPNAIMSNYSMGSKIKDITSRLEQLCQDRIELGLQRIAGGASSPTAAAHQRPPSSSVPTERENAREAALCEKLNLHALTLEWGSQFDNSRDVAVEEHVLDILQPHKCIKKVAIRNYGGARFPLWIGDPLFSKIEFLELENCNNCVSLPSLGLLSSLKHLAVKGMKKLKSIESEVYGEGFSMPFPSLKILRFENLPEWWHWDTDIKGNVHVDIFPRLQELSVVKCPKLSGKLPELLPSLEILVVSKCEKLVVSLSSYPRLYRLEVDECKELVCRTPIDSKLIKFMTISNSSLDMIGCKGMLYDSQAGSSLPKPMTTTNVLEFGKLLEPGFQILETLVCKRDQGKEWPKIAHIPWVVMDGKFIYDPELE